MLISICIPQYNRSEYLCRVLESIRDQDHRDIEIVVSDDRSKDNTAQVIPPLLDEIKAKTGIRTRYIQQEKNLGYDGNVRAALSGASGDYLFLLGNDDALAGPQSLSRLAALIAKLNEPDVLFCNPCDFSDRGQVHRRAKRTALLGKGPEVAMRVFRCFSFFSGIILKRTAFAPQDTSRYDGSIYIQIYLATRIIAAGGMLASIDEALVAKDVTIGERPADTYRDTLARDNATATIKTGGLDCVGWVATEAVSPYVPERRRQAVVRRIFGQILLWTYPYWLLDYRSLGVRQAAKNLSRGCRPANLLKRVPTSFPTRLWLRLIYAVSTTGGLLAPIRLLRFLARLMSPFSKKS
ncbi:MAG: glycosyltransferase [Planctomycetes bacterium]|nr:glycosyltransferase [Planctomycetota bacterium]